MKNESKVLVLGLPGSGCQTLLKQLRKIYGQSEDVFSDGVAIIDSIKQQMKTIATLILHASEFDDENAKV
jgi:hypothetical protein